VRAYLRKHDLLPVRNDRGASANSARLVR
jgi:hypothetical protein